MIQFTDKRLYLKGTSDAICTDKVTGDIVYFSNKFQSGNVTTSVTMGEIRAGLGNAVAAIIPSDATVNVEFTAADFSLFAKSAQLGATLKYSAPVMTCQNVTADGTSLTIDVTKGTPVAQLGMAKPQCYVQEVGAASLIAVGGKAYDISNAGAVTGFTAVSGKTYKVWYFANRADAQLATITTMLDPKVVHFTAAMAVYANESGSAQNEGTRQGTLYVIIPSLKFGANGGVTGDQTNNDTTSLSGQAVINDSTIISDSCDECSGGGSELAYYLYVPCATSAENVEGIVANVGSISVATSGKYQMQPRIVMMNGELVKGDANTFTYTATGAPTGTTVGASTGLITAGTTAGDFEVEVSYVVGETTFKDTCDVSVTA